jgi:hypothetical protein
MILVPFLILVLGAAWCGLMIAARDNVVVRRPRFRLNLSLATAGLMQGMTAAIESARKFQEALVQITAALAIPMAEATERMTAAMRRLDVTTADEARRLITRRHP